MEIPLFIRSIDGKGKPGDFTITVNPHIELNPNGQHILSMDQINISYSWHNIDPQFNNNKVKYSKDSGTTWKEIVFSPGIYNYMDINQFLHNTIKTNENIEEKDVGINIDFDITRYKVMITLKANWQLDLKNSTFCDLVGFDPKIVGIKKYSTRLPNITNSVDGILVRCSLIDESVLSGVKSDVLYMIPSDNLTRSYPFLYPLKSSFRR